MTNIEILKDITKYAKEHKISTYEIFVTLSCEDDWKLLEKSKKKKIQELIKSEELTFDTFCEISDDLWCDSDGFGLTCIAAAIRGYIEAKGRLPKYLCDLDDEGLLEY